MNKYEKELHGNHGNMAELHPSVKLNKNDWPWFILLVVLMGGFFGLVSYLVEIRAFIDGIK